MLDKDGHLLTERQLVAAILNGQDISVFVDSPAEVYLP